ncbi:hypothetical protein MMC11_008888 [Xylographa trunciseda]|nr:hypothetical protein [Xylographa trunciseda]
MSASKGDLARGTPTDPSYDQYRLQSSSSTYLGAGERRCYEFEESTSRPEPSTKRRHLDSSPLFLPVDISLNTSQVAVAEQLPLPEVTNSSDGHQHPSELHSNPSLSQKPRTEPRGVANPISE